MKSEISDGEMNLTVNHLTGGLTAKKPKSAINVTVVVFMLVMQDAFFPCKNNCIALNNECFCQLLPRRPFFNRNRYEI